CFVPIPQHSRPLPVGRRFSAMEGSARRRAEALRCGRGQIESDRRSTLPPHSELLSSKGVEEMSAPPKSPGEPITGNRQLVEYFEQGCKPVERWRIGTEHEKFAFDRQTLRTLPYEGRNGIGALLGAMQRFGWQPIEEAGHVIAL